MLFLYVLSAIEFTESTRSYQSFHVEETRKLTEIMPVGFPMDHNKLKAGTRNKEYRQKTIKPKSLTARPIL